ncbi:MAG: hypothetical protein CVU86_08415 [Firmicutes bacterium HGW-Firmicutes-11]|jgi:hypothetical protein|nr:MAG: hypothetical protein CVU86_08415 [Firmicutes bacterium HGW-Firmicutes-11]
MAKKLISVWLSLTVLLFSTITIYAEEDIVQGQFLNRTIDINGNRIENYYLENPVFLYQGTAYLPLTGELGDLLGFAVDMDQESRTLTLTKTDPIRTSLQEEVLKSDLTCPPAKVVKDIDVVIKAVESRRRPNLPVSLQGISATAADIDIGGQLTSMRRAEADTMGIPVFAQESLDKETYSILMANDVYYVPVRALTGESCFGWNLLFDDYTGLYISTDPEVPVNAYFDRAESDYNRGLAQYIVSRNSAISIDKATMLVFLFRHEAKVNDVDEILLMAMAQKESTFRTDAVGGTAIGLMQITVGTAARYGISKDQLYDPHTNIEFGAKYIGDKLDHYDDKVIALTAYNAGGAAISRGSYTTRYAGRITDAEASIRDFLVNKGFGLGSGI